MYYLIMKTAVKPGLNSKTFCVSKSYTRLTAKEIGFVGFKFYQKLFVVFISLSTILIFPESPRELEKICEIHNTKNVCNVW